MLAFYPIAVDFSGTIGVGSVFVAMVVVIAFGLVSLRDRSIKSNEESIKRWENLYELADAERKEKDQELTNLKDTHRTTVAELEHLRGLTDYTEVRKEQQAFHLQLVTVIQSISEATDRNFNMTRAVHTEVQEGMSDIAQTLDRVRDALERISPPKA